MQVTEQEPIVPSDEADIGPTESEYVLNIAGVYQDLLTRDWAAHVCEQAIQIAGAERVQTSWFEVPRLGEPETLIAAVQAALLADVIVVSVHAADELPLDLYVWIDVWLPRRSSRMGALVALIGASGKPTPQAVRTQEYLQAVARRAELDFMPHECRVPDEMSFASIPDDGPSHPYNRGTAR